MNLFREVFTHIRSFSSDFWVVIAATLMNQAGNMAMVFLVVYLTSYIGLTLSAASFAFAVFSLSMLVSGLYGGSLIDRLGAIWIMTVSLVANGIILLFFTMVHHYPSILLMCLLWGFVYGLYRPASQTFISQLASPGRFKITFSVYRLALNLGMSIGPAIGGFLAGYAFYAVFIANGIANLLAAFVLILGLKHRGWFKVKTNSQSKLELNLKWLKSDASLRLFVLGMIPVSMVFFQHESTLAIFLHDSLQFPLTFYGLLFTINTLIIVFCELSLNVAMINWSYRSNLMLGTLFITLGFFGLYFATTKAYVIVMTFLWTLGEMMLYPAASSYVADIAPKENQGAYMSIYSTCSNIGMLFGPWGGAILMQYLGASGLWLACGIIGIGSIALFSQINEPVTIHAN